AEFISPTGADTSSQPEYTVAVLVRSKRLLKRVEVRRGDDVFPVDVSKARGEGDDFVLNEQVPVKLVDGINRLEVIAFNTDGQSLPTARTAVDVTYKPAAVLVRVLRVEVQKDNGVEVLAETTADGVVTYQKASQAMVWLVGEVRWSDPKAKAL